MPSKEKQLCYICSEQHADWRDCKWRKYGDSPYRGKFLENGHRPCLLCGGDHAARNCYSAPSKMHWHSKNPNANLGGPKYDPNRPRNPPTATGHAARAADDDDDDDSDNATVDSQTANVEAAVEESTRTVLQG